MEDPDRRFSQEESRFFEAIKADDDQTVIELLGNQEFLDYLKLDKLSLAFVQVILLNSVKLLKVLVTFGTDIQEADLMFRESGLMHAVRYGHVDMMLYLLSEGVQVNHQSNNGSTALHVAVENQKIECLKVLVKQRGVDLNIQDCSGYSPLLWSARLRDWQAMKILIDAGCNIESVNFTKGVNALHVCVDSERAFWKGKTADAADIVKCIDILLKAGLDIDRGDNFGNPPLVYALQSNNITGLKHLLKLNCRTECKNIGTSDLFYFEPTTNDLPIVGTDRTQLPLYTAIFKLHIRALKILCVGGAPYHKLQREPQVLLYAVRSQTLHQFLAKVLAKPLTLKDTCRRVIRRNIGQKICDGVDELSLPLSLKSYVCLQDLDVM